MGWEIELHREVDEWFVGLCRPDPVTADLVEAAIAFDPFRRAILLVAGDQAGNWKRWSEVKADKLAIDVQAGRDVAVVWAEAEETTRAYVLGFRLAQLRDEAGVSQPRISQLEQGDPGQMELDTIARYVAALGGRLRIVADFDDHGVTVSEPAHQSA